MIKGDKSSWLILGAAAAVMAAAVGILVSSFAEDSVVEEARPVDRISPGLKIGDATRQKALPKQTPIPSEQLLRIAKRPDAEVSFKTNAPASAVAEKDDTDELMDKVVKEIMSQLNDAVKRRDIKSILALADKLKALRYGAKAGSAGCGSASVKRTLLGALEECGLDGIPQIARLVNDSDVAIAREATERIFKTLNDISLSDSQRAEIVVEVSAEMTDTSSLVRLYNEFVKMRHSVGAEALVAISESGTAEAKEQLPRVISAFTGDVSITSADQLAEWLPDHADNSWDDKLYGGIKLESVQTEEVR